MNNVMLFRIKSGEEVIAKIIDTAADGWTIKNPAIIIPLGQGKLGLAPWLPYCTTDSFFLPKDATLFTGELRKEMVNDYSTNFGSGLVVPDKGVEEASNLRLVQG